MSRKLRIQYPGAIYHVASRGDHRERIFKDDRDRQRFLDTLGESCAKTNWLVHAFCLMPNHFHLVWCLGSEAFRQELLAQVSTQRGLWHFGPELHESAAAKAQRIISSELNAMGMTEQDFERQPKGAPFKVDLALKLRAEMTVTLGWAGLPSVCTWGSVVT